MGSVTFPTFPKFPTEETEGFITSFLNGYCQTRYHLIGNLELNKVSVTLYVNDSYADSKFGWTFNVSANMYVDFSRAR